MTFWARSLRLWTRMLPPYVSKGDSSGSWHPFRYCPNSFWFPKHAVDLSSVVNFGVSSSSSFDNYYVSSLIFLSLILLATVFWVEEPICWLSYFTSVDLWPNCWPEQPSQLCPSCAVWCCLLPPLLRCICWMGFWAMSRLKQLVLIHVEFLIDILTIHDCSMSFSRIAIYSCPI